MITLFFPLRGIFLETFTLVCDNISVTKLYGDKMRYKSVKKGKFIKRPNRFIAEVELDGKTEVVHVKNTGRCRELLIPGATVILAASDNEKRKTKYDLIAVYKGAELINIDSQAPNALIGEWLENSGIFKNVTCVKPESKYKSSRFDFYVAADGREAYVEVKGVTLERDGVVLFPDAPTERGVKHLTELCDAAENGCDAYVFFVIQMKNCRYFTPNREMHGEFADALLSAKSRGVKIFAVNCSVSEDELTVCDFIPCKL